MTGNFNGLPTSRKLYGKLSELTSADPSARLTSAGNRHRCPPTLSAQSPRRPASMNASKGLIKLAKPSAMPDVSPQPMEKPDRAFTIPSEAIKAQVKDSI